MTNQALNFDSIIEHTNVDRFFAGGVFASLVYGRLNMLIASYVEEFAQGPKFDDAQQRTEEMRADAQDLLSWALEQVPEDFFPDPTETLDRFIARNANPELTATESMKIEALVEASDGDISDAEASELILNERLGRAAMAEENRKALISLISSWLTPGVYEGWTPNVYQELAVGNAMSQKVAKRRASCLKQVLTGPAKYQAENLATMKLLKAVETSVHEYIRGLEHQIEAQTQPINAGAAEELVVH